MRVKPKYMTRSLLAAAVSAGALATAMPAAAQDAAPAPMDCAGLSVKDATGDNVAADAITGAENTDITGVFFRYTEAKKLTANIQVVNLDKSLTDGTTATRWTLDYSVGEDSFYAMADLNAAGSVSFVHGKVGDATAGDIQRPAATEGRFVEGPNGVIEIVLPSEGLEGKKLADIAAESRGIWVAFEGSSLGPLLDSAPDEGTGKSFTVAACPTGAAAAGGGGTTTTPVSNNTGTTTGEQPQGPAPQSTTMPDQSQSGSTKDQPSKASSKSSSKKKACQKKAKKIKNKRKRKAALKRCAKIKK